MTEVSEAEQRTWWGGQNHKIIQENFLELHTDHAF